eukprot:SAG31_NODE_4974_length_2824_cov_1.164771_4_plen_167_part_00
MLRIRFEHGWVSLRTGDDTPLLEVVEDADSDVEDDSDSSEEDEEIEGAGDGADDVESARAPPSRSRRKSKNQQEEESAGRTTAEPLHEPVDEKARRKSKGKNRRIDAEESLLANAGATPGGKKSKSAEKNSQSSADRKKRKSRAKVKRPSLYRVIYAEGVVKLFIT